MEADYTGSEKYEWERLTAGTLVLKAVAICMEEHAKTYRLQNKYRTFSKTKTE